MVLNTQPITKKAKPFFAGHLNVHSMFHTIQGEGPFSGRPAVFIRLAGCNLQCPMCDTEYTDGATVMDINKMVSAVQATPIQDGGLVVITGGEPFRQNIGLLIAKLLDVKFIVQVETNGTLPPPDLCGYSFNSQVTNPVHGAYIVCSPKTGKVNKEVISRACCFKYVLDADHMNPDDGLPTMALGHTAHPQLARPPAWWDRPVYLQPADEKSTTQNSRNIAAVVKSSMDFGYTLQLQIHKELGVE